VGLIQYFVLFVIDLKSRRVKIAGILPQPGERHLRRAVTEYTEHYHHERNHQGIGNELIERSDEIAQGRVACRERLGGVLKYYYRRAA
jgi:hypothetical protein